MRNLSRRRFMSAMTSIGAIGAGELLRGNRLQWLTVADVAEPIVRFSKRTFADRLEPPPKPHCPNCRCVMVYLFNPPTLALPDEGDQK